MRLLRDPLDAGDLRSSVVTIGNFDGVHLGHRVVFDRALAEAKQRNAPCVAITFEPHPVKFLRPEKHLRLIYPYSERVQGIEALGVDALVIQTFDDSLRSTSAFDYCRDFLRGVLDIRHLVVGHDFTFGRGRDGSFEHLSRIGEEFGFSVERVPALQIQGEPVSSSRIRKAIIRGEVALVRQLLGGPFSLVGEVVPGDGRGGAQLGFPTANLSVQRELIPAQGVYLTCVEYGGERFAALTNVGDNPTFHHHEIPPRVETWIIDFDRDILGREIRVHFIERLREELTFSTKEELIERIRQDEKQARKMLIKVDPCAF
ncbi:MAG: bifunctional riboflavin kinase/FAD synthetase [Candidatus Alcyoniella australis]|nr:bifunctional riboflavin kinase/FAD synthetase [Candidatus Alcyoniella australis]